MKKNKQKVNKKETKKLIKQELTHNLKNDVLAMIAQYDVNSKKTDKIINKSVNQLVKKLIKQLDLKPLLIQENQEVATPAKADQSAAKSKPTAKKANK